MFIIEGNIGAGKSTLLKLIKEYIPETHIIFEPVDDWQQELFGQSLLAQFYNDPHRWAYTFETLTLIRRTLDLIKHTQKNTDIYIMERSVFSGFYCFANNSYKQGFMSTLEWNIYNEFFNFLTSHSYHFPKGFIYLRVEPQCSYQRLQVRNRKAENSIPLFYLEQIHQRHEDFLIKKHDILQSLKSVPVLILDGNQEFATSAETIQKHITSIKQFIYQ